jgi:hypothetical protein
VTTQVALYPAVRYVLHALDGIAIVSNVNRERLAAWNFTLAMRRVPGFPIALEQWCMDSLTLALRAPQAA